METSGKRVFIAEDEAVIMAGFRMSLRRLGYQIAGVASNGITAIEKIRELKPDLVIIDINMPGCDGLSVMHEINQDELIPFIVITGYYSDELVDQAMEMGAFGYLMKPVDYRQLGAALEVAFGRYHEFMKSQNEVENLRHSLEDRKYIERAKGILMKKYGVSEAEGMKRLQKMARDRGLKLAVISQKIIEADNLLG